MIRVTTLAGRAAVASRIPREDGVIGKINRIDEILKSS
jgi:hypothetical protein